MSGLIVAQFKSQNIRFETRKDGRVWGNLTDMAKATNKKVNDYLRLSSTNAYLQGLQAVTGIPVTALVQVFQGGNESLSYSQGTWAIDLVVIDFAQWCNVEFRIWANAKIIDLINHGVVFVDQSVRDEEYFQKEQGLTIEQKARNSLEIYLEKLENCSEDPLAAIRYSKVIDTLNVTLHRNQDQTEKSFEENDFEDNLELVNPIQEFFKDHIEKTENEEYRLSSKRLYGFYCSFCKKKGYKAGTQTAFGLQAAKIANKVRLASGVYYLGIALK